jgi:hypothetical protein
VSEEVYEEERRVKHFFQPLPFYYLELAHSLFQVDPIDTFGPDFSTVSSYCDLSEELGTRHTHLRG